jgi:biotin/methionine sulfoxide reductase
MPAAFAARTLPHSSHWGAFSVRLRDGGVEIVPHPRDASPSPLLGNIPASLSHRARISRPMVRSGWLERGPGADRRRGREPFVPVDWPRALDIVATELRRVYTAYGPHGVYGGSYGWASAGRFHDAPRQLHRFLNVAGGYVRSVGSYSSGAASVILPHVIGPQEAVAGNNVSWDELVAHSALVLAFGGMALKNNDVGGGGTSEHIALARLRAAHRRGAEFHLIGPLRDDLPAETEAVWHPIRPGTDVALMLGIAHTLVTEGLHDRAFLDRYCVGYEIFEGYLLGQADGKPKDADWASAICGMPVDGIVGLARHAAGRRTLITCSQSLQRAEHGEQPVWMGVVLAALRVRLRAGIDLQHRKAAIGRAAADIADRAQQHCRFHSGGAHRRHAASSGGGVRLQWPAAHLPRHQAGLLGGRQSLPPPSGSEPAARRVCTAGHRHRA